MTRLTPEKKDILEQRLYESINDKLTNIGYNIRNLSFPLL